MIDQVGHRNKVEREWFVLDAFLISNFRASFMCLGFFFVLYQTGCIVLGVSGDMMISRYGNRFSHDTGKTFEQWTIHTSLVMTVVKQSIESRTDVNRNLQRESTLHFPQFTFSFVTSVKTEKNCTQEFRDGKEWFSVAPAMFTTFIKLTQSDNIAIFVLPSSRTCFLFTFGALFLFFPSKHVCLDSNWLDLRSISKVVHHRKRIGFLLVICSPVYQTWNLAIVIGVNIVLWEFNMVKVKVCQYTLSEHKSEIHY